MRTVFALIMISTTLLSSSPSTADDDCIAAAKSLTANQYDQSLPALPVEQWITSALRNGMAAVWGEYATDCGERTGVPATDRDRDMPMCAEIELKENGRSAGYIHLIIGTEKRGISSRNARVLLRRDGPERCQNNNE